MSARLALALSAILGTLGAVAATPAAAVPGGVETQRVIVIRHGEKPAAGLGQLTCQGLARSLALPDVVVAKFGEPYFLFAPNPGRQKDDRGRLYYYIRPLATLEPLAIRLGRPVDLRFGFDQGPLLGQLLSRPQYADTTTIVAWEHKWAVPMMQALVKAAGGDAKQVVPWADDDFDRMDVIEIVRDPAMKPVITYSRQKQGLDGLPNECPKAPAR